MEIVGLSGWARSGKDEAANVLVEEHGFIRVAFADKLRDVLYALNPVLDSRQIVHGSIGWEETPTVVTQYTYLRDIINSVGWNGYKETQYGPEIRRLLQRLGTEAGRETLWDSIWVDAAFANLPQDAKVVVTDVRFPNEVEAVEERGGTMWRVTRTGVGPANDHASEMVLNDWPIKVRLNNNGTLEEFHRAVSKTYESRQEYAIVFSKPVEV